MGALRGLALLLSPSAHALPSLCSSLCKPQFTSRSRPSQPAPKPTVGPRLYNTWNKITRRRNQLARLGSTGPRLGMTCKQGCQGLKRTRTVTDTRKPWEVLRATHGTKSSFRVPRLLWDQSSSVSNCAKDRERIIGHN